MEPLPRDNLTDLLNMWSDGDETALEKLIPHVERELHRIAHHHMRREDGTHTLQTTALVNEAYLKLIDQNVRWRNRAHFFAIASQLMRRVLLDHARTQLRAKRGGGVQHITLTDAVARTDEPSVDLLALDRALDKLAKMDSQKSKIVEMRYFGGLSVEEVAEVLKLAPSTIARHWAMAKAWLRREMEAKTYS
jgi:RNA polymerase sigma-70 factor, ECF subfamily